MKRVLLFLALNFLSICLCHSQDYIVKKSGDTLKVKIIETGVTEIKYKNYGDLSGLTYGIFKSAVLCIKYQSGWVQYLGESEDVPSEKACYCGHQDAAKYHGKKGTHFVLGVLFGPFAMIGTAFARPSPYNGRRTTSMSKNQELFSDLTYLKCYRKKAKKDLIGMEAVGWGAWLFFVFSNN